MLKAAAFALVLVIGTLFVTPLQAQGWHFGIGTGILRLNTEGDIGLNTTLLGPTQVAVDLSPEDFDDLMESAIGGGGYLTNGTWMVGFSVGKLKLQDNPTGTLPSGAELTASEVFFEITSGEVTVGYVAYRSPTNSVSVTPHVGARYTKHELGADLTILQGATSTDITRGVDHNWTDVLIGASAAVRVVNKVTWNVRADAGFGGSEGTYLVSTGISWQPHRRFSIGPIAKFMAVEVENGERGDADWYFYDANEFGWGIGFLLHF